MPYPIYYEYKKPKQNLPIFFYTFEPLKVKSLSVPFLYRFLLVSSVAIKKFQLSYLILLDQICESSRQYSTSEICARPVLKFSCLFIYIQHYNCLFKHSMNILTTRCELFGSSTQSQLVNFCELNCNHIFSTIRTYIMNQDC